MPQVVAVSLLVLVVNASTPGAAAAAAAGACAALATGVAAGVAVGACQKVGGPLGDVDVPDTASGGRVVFSPAPAMTQTSSVERVAARDNTVLV